MGSAPTGIGPSELAVDSQTHTVYVANGNNDNGPSPGGNTVSVIDTSHCRSLDVSRCQGPWPTITVGSEPSTIAVDAATDTVYVTNTGDNTVSVFNGATCDALNTSGCGQKPATVPVGVGPIGILADDANQTLYVANFNNGNGPPKPIVSMIDMATCNAADLGGCPTTPPTTFVDVESPPDDVDMDVATHTVYVATLTNTVAFDADTCNATVQSGCETQGTLNGDPYSGPNGFEVDQANDTLYTANYDNTISAFDLADCNASDLADCAAQTPGTVSPFPYSTGEHALWVAVDIPLHSVYVSYQRDDGLVVVDTNVCNGSNLAGCATLHPPVARTGAQPESVAFDPQTQTLYAANQTDNDVSVIDATRCNAQVTSGCRQAPPTIPIPSGKLAADPAVNTLYIPTTGTAVAMVNTRTCSAETVAGCAATPPQFNAGGAGTNAHAVAVDPLTNTVYIANFGSYSTPGTGTVWVVNAATCNATDTTGCGSLSTLQVPGGNADDIAVDALTDTVYVGTITDSGPNLLSVFNGATCNAGKASGCNQTPATVAFGDSGGAFFSSVVNIAVNPATNTIYASNITYIDGSTSGNNVYVINGAVCDAADTAGCNQTPATVTTGVDPWGLAIDQASDTVYVAIEDQGDYAGTVAIINGATCNGSTTSGCAQPPPTVAAGFGVVDLAIDPTSRLVYATNEEDASISLIDAATCNRLINLGCAQTRPRLPAGSYPAAIALDPGVDTVYVSNVEGVSVIPLAH